MLQFLWLRKMVCKWQEVCWKKTWKIKASRIPFEWGPKGYITDEVRYIWCWKSVKWFSHDQKHLNLMWQELKTHRLRPNRMDFSRFYNSIGGICTSLRLQFSGQRSKMLLIECSNSRKIFLAKTLYSHSESTTVDWLKCSQKAFISSSLFAGSDLWESANNHQLPSRILLAMKEASPLQPVQQCVCISPAVWHSCQHWGRIIEEFRISITHKSQSLRKRKGPVGKLFVGKLTQFVLS